MSETNIARHIDRKAARFLRAVEYYGGSATMTDIRQRTGLSRDAANHRFRRLEELNLIDVSYAAEGHGNRTPPKVAHLTGVARREIERGLLAFLGEDPQRQNEVVDVVAEVRELRERIDRHQNRLNTLTGTRPDDDRLETRLDSVESHLDELDDYVTEWNEAAETYMRALRAALEDKGVAVGEYFQRT
jgi:DNA-binding Lrp family transcriptional regulator